MKVKPVDYLTTYQAVLKIEGYLKTNDELIGFWIKDAAPNERFPVKTFQDLIDKYSAGYSSVNWETGYVEAKIMPSGLIHFWNIMARIDAHTTNH